MKSLAMVSEIPQGIFIPQITQAEFKQFQTMLFIVAGITIQDGKTALVVGRLAKRLRHYGVDNFSDYLAIINDPKFSHEKGLMIELLTTNETYFFREPAHFDYLRMEILAKHPCNEPFRLWCGASSSGEEVYTLAMILAEKFGSSGWEIVASDINTQMLAVAQRGIYPAQAAERIPSRYLARYCLKGVRSQEGVLMIDKVLRNNIHFEKINLNESLPPSLGQFDLVFLRNVMIYFNMDTKRKVVSRIHGVLKHQGHFIISHAENLHQVSEQFKTVRPSIYKLF